MRHLVIATALLTLTALPALVQEEPSPTPSPAPPPASDAFYPSRYIGQGDAYNCADFVSQADAQAVLRADPADPNDLDHGGIPGVACESNKAPKDLVPVPH